MAKIGTTDSVITQNALEQYLVINSSSSTFDAGFTALTGLNISVNGTEIVSLTTNQIIERAFSVSNQVGGMTAITAGGNSELPHQLVLPLADGKIEGVNVNYSFSGATGADAYNVYANSENLGTENFFWSTSTINSLSNNVFQDFRTLIVPEENGECIVNWVNGFSSKFTLDVAKEMVSLSSGYMSQVNILGDSIGIYNYDGSIASVQYFNNDSSNAQTVILNR